MSFFSFCQSALRKIRSLFKRSIYSIYNLKERVLFDMVHGVQTSERVELKDFLNATSLDHGKSYYASWSSEVKNAHQVLRNLLQHRFIDHLFIDVGCGKGKVCLLWTMLNKKSQVQQPVMGLDYYLPFIDTAKRNHQKLFKNEGNFVHCNAKDFHFLALKKPLIIYLFNPFEEPMLNELLNKIGKIPVYIVYNIPMHWGIFQDHGYRRVYSKTGSNQNQITLIFTNSSIK